MVKNGKKDTFEKHLKVYSAAAAGVLALAPSAEAAIQYGGVQNISVSQGNTPVSIDLNNDGNNDFNFSYYNPASLIKVIALNDLGNGFIGVNTGASSIHDVANIPSNYLIGPTLASNIWRSVNFSALNGTFVGTSGLFNNTIGFIGVRFHSDTCQSENYHYGWIRYQGTTNTTIAGTIIDWAYEDQCNTPITAGAGSTATIPTLNQWGIIILISLLAGLSAKMLKKEEKEES